MVGSAMLKACLAAADVEKVLAIGRSKLHLSHPKLESVALENLLNYENLNYDLSGFDACLFCLGTSIGDSSEDEYKRLNQSIPLAAAKAMVEANPNMRFVYVSGKGTDSTENGSVTWARIKGGTENGLLEMGFNAVYLLRPALIIPMNGEESKTKVYRELYRYTGWAMRAVQRIFPGMITDTEKLGAATLNLLRSGTSSMVVENHQINKLAVKA